MNGYKYTRLISQDELEHHGVKGQRWGVTRTPEELGHRAAKTPIEKWKSKQRAKVDHLYEKTYRSLDTVDRYV